MTWILFYLSLILVSALFIKYVAASNIREYFLDTPNHRKMHQRLVPRMGGFVIIIISLISFLAIHFIKPFNENLLLSVLVILSAVLIIGVFDDSVVVQKYQIKKNGPKSEEWEFRPRYKLLIEFILAAVVIVKLDLVFPSFGFELPYGINFTFSMIWIVGVMNALNIIDGIDGLAGGISTLVLTALGGIFLYLGHVEMALVVFMVVAANIGFLLNNFSPANVFFGDAGSLFQGAMIGVFSLALFSLPETSKNPLAMTILVGYPVAEMALSMFRRMVIHPPRGTSLKLRLKNMLVADSNHVHHRILFKGLNHQETCIIIYMMGIFLTLGGVLLTLSTISYSWLLMAWIFFGYYVFIDKVYSLSKLIPKNSKNYKLEQEIKTFKVALMSRDDELLSYGLQNSRGHHFLFVNKKRLEIITELSHWDAYVLEKDRVENDQEFYDTVKTFLVGNNPLIVVVISEAEKEYLMSLEEVKNANCVVLTRPIYAVAVIQHLQEMTAYSYKTKSEEVRQSLLSRAEIV